MDEVCAICARAGRAAASAKPAPMAIQEALAIRILAALCHYTGTMTSILASSRSEVRGARLARGLTQDELARRAGLSRQALGAIEAGAYQPGVSAALALARALGETVEALFGSAGEPALLEAVCAEQGGERRAAAMPTVSRVELGRVGGRLIAMAEPPPAMRLAAAGGVLRHASGRRWRVAAFRTQQEIDGTLLLAGCDPGVAIFSDWMRRNRSTATVVPIPRSSSAALSALLGGNVHAAGVHLCDDQGGEDNLAAVRAIVGGRRALMVNFARWELGIGVRRNNPMSVGSIADFGRSDVRIVNREPGSGARRVLDRGLAACNITPQAVAGYERELSGHLEVAAAIAGGQADAGLTLRVAAEAWNLGFVPVREERYDLVILQREADSPPVRAMLDALNSASFANEVGQLCAYDTSRMGSIVARLNS